MITSEITDSDTNHSAFIAAGTMLNPIRGEQTVVTQGLEKLVILSRSGEVVARFALFSNPALKVEGKDTICIGHFECVNDALVAQSLFQLAEQLARGLNGDFLLGPMNGSTWHSYRISDSNEQPLFFSEPFTPAYYNELFTAAGFHKVASYVSNLDDSLQVDAAALETASAHFGALGLRFRCINLADYARELLRIAAFCNQAFQHNFLFSPIEPQQFQALYAGLAPVIDPRLVILAEHKPNELAGLIFCFEDRLNTAKRTLVVKTLARDPNPKFRGLGEHLIALAYQQAVELGYEQAIHAFMLSGKASEAISVVRYRGKEFKGYSLYGREIRV